MNNVVNILQLNQLISDTRIYAVIVFLIALGIAYVISMLIPWEGGSDKSYIKRRISFIIVGIVAAFGFWVYNDQIVVDCIKQPGFQSMFRSANLQCLGITVVGYYVLGIILMLVFRHSKFGSILGKEKGSSVKCVDRKGIVY